MSNKFTKAHIKRVEKRLQEYEDVLSKGKFEKLGSCNVCRHGGASIGAPCTGCLFQHPNNMWQYCDTIGSTIGAWCTTKAEQRKQYKHLLSLLAANEYAFK